MGPLLAVSVVDSARFLRDGYVVVDDVLEPTAVDHLRGRVLAMRDAWGLGSGGGTTIADFLAIPDFRFLHDLPRHPKLLSALHGAFGGPDFRFCSHNDIGIDRTVGWHKDKLNHEYAWYQTLPLWPRRGRRERAGHFILKAAIYLQDHTDDDGALRLLPASHKTRVVQRNATAMVLHPRKGSFVLFEQRITHRGQLAADPGRGRVMISLGFGRRNAWTDEFEAGTRARQVNTTACQRLVRRRFAQVQSVPSSAVPPPHTSESYAALMHRLISSGTVASTLLSNRRVALIGPAGYLSAHDVTPLLDGIDVVARPNVQVDLSTRTLRLPPLTSRRCDVVYHSGAALGMQLLLSDGKAKVDVHPEAALSNDTLTVYAEQGVRAVVVVQQSAARVRHFTGLLAHWQSRLHLEQLPKAKVPTERHFRTGLKALLHVIHAGPASVLLLGYDFYASPSSPRGFDGYYARTLAGENASRFGDAPAHDSALELGFFAQLLQRSPALHVDAHLARVMRSTVGMRVAASQLVGPLPMRPRGAPTATTTAKPEPKLRASFTSPSTSVEET